MTRSSSVYYTTLNWMLSIQKPKECYSKRNI